MIRKRIGTWALLPAILVAISACNDSRSTDTPAQTESAPRIESVEKGTVQTFLDQPVNELGQLVEFDLAEHRQWLAPTDAFVQFTDAPEKNSSELEIEFSPKVNRSLVRIEPSQAWDLSAFPESHIAFDVQNLSDRSTHFYLDNEDSAGHYQSRSLSLPAGYSGTVYVPLLGEQAETDIGFWGDLEPWPSNEKMMIWRSWRGEYRRNDLRALTFSSIGLLEPRKIRVSNIRLRRNPPVDKQWLSGLIDKFGQNSAASYALKVDSEKALKDVADRELAELAASNGMPDRSRFGGYKDGPKLPATGYFRTEKIDGKWWMVDPDGYLFFSHGPANVRMANLTTITGVDYKDDSVRVVKPGETTPEDSMGIIHVSDEVKDSRFIASEQRHGLFEWLPGYNDELAEHYSYRRSTHKGPIDHGETFSFYRANLERRYGQSQPESYVQKWEQVTIDRMKDWGFTSFGNWVDPAFYQHNKVPYFANGWIIGDFQTLSGYENHWGLMPDPFDPVFSERARKTIELIAKDVNSSPWCVGIFVDNEKSWGEREGTVPQRYGVILDALSKDAKTSPAKAAFSKHIQEKYESIAELNKAWQLDLLSWQQFDSKVEFSNYSERLVSDLSRLLELLGEQYFIVVHNTLAEIMPNHLYMGARMANWGMPDEIIKASLTYSDVLSFNIYEEGMQAEHWGFLEEVDLPVVIGEFHIGATEGSGFLQPGIVHAADQEDRARMYKRYMQSVLEKPYMVGAHWFQYVDEPVSGRAFDGENSNIGFVSVTDIPYPEMVNAVKEVTRDLYPKRLAK